VSSRERDRLGRPLAAGLVGVPGPVSRSDRAPDETLSEAQQWLDRGQPFAAHEVLEDAWRSCPPGERELWQGLAQLAVGLTHALRGNPTGSDALLARGIAKLAPYQVDPPFGIDVDGLLAWAASRPLGSAPRLR
jgi:hypothetical protein